VLVVIGVLAGLLWGVWMACFWGLHKSRRVWPDLLLVALLLSQVAYAWGVDGFGWPTPGSIAESIGAATGPADQWLLAGISLVTTAVVVAVLVRAGVTRRLERWSREPE
jgi:hypothetical protein